MGSGRGLAVGRFEVVLEMLVDADGELCEVVVVVVVVAADEVVGVGVGVTGVSGISLVDVDVGVVGVEVEVVAAASNSSVVEATASNGNDNASHTKLCEEVGIADSGKLPSRLWEEFRRCPLELCLLLRSPELRAGCGSEWCPVMDVGDMGGVRRRDWSEIGLCRRYTGDELYSDCFFGLCPVIVIDMMLVAKVVRALMSCSLSFFEVNAPIMHFTSSMVSVSFFEPIISSNS